MGKVKNTWLSGGLISESAIDPRAHASLSSTSPTTPRFQRTLKLTMTLVGAKHLRNVENAPALLTSVEVAFAQ